MLDHGFFGKAIMLHFSKAENHYLFSSSLSPPGFPISCFPGPESVDTFTLQPVDGATLPQLTSILPVPSERNSVVGECHGWFLNSSFAFVRRDCSNDG
jgi:hypothetical protein